MEEYGFEVRSMFAFLTVIDYGERVPFRASQIRAEIESLTVRGARHVIDPDCVVGNQVGLEHVGMIGIS